MTRERRADCQSVNPSTRCVLGRTPRRVVAAVVLMGAVVLAGAPGHTGDNYAPATLDRYFRFEWTKSGRAISGYVYNSSNRYASHMQLLVESVDRSGTVVAKTTTWVLRGVPANNRAFFEVSVPDAPAYRVRVLSFDWVDDRRDRRLW